MKTYLTVVAACIRGLDKLLICQRKADDDFGSLWEFPGGKREDNETMDAALIREIEEELGVQIEVVRFLSVFEDENDDLRISVHLFESQIRSGQPKTIDCQDWRWINVEELDSFDLAPVDKKIAKFLKESI
jgi:mutator protein MutT